MVENNSICRGDILCLSEAALGVLGEHSLEIDTHPVPLEGSVASAVQKMDRCCLQNLRELYCPQHATVSGSL